MVDGTGKSKAAPFGKYYDTAYHKIKISNNE
jgi:hypothetical protein